MRRDEGSANLNANPYDTSQLRSPADNGRPIFSKDDLAFGDIVVLLFEFSDELDRLGAPAL